MHIWSDVIPSKKEIESFYKDDFYQHSKKSTDLITSLNRKRFLKCINKKKGVITKLLDIGAGDGSLDSFLKERGFDAYGVEPSKIGRSIAKKYWNVDLIAGEVSDIQNMRFDVINLSHVLEHVIDPLAVLEKIHNLLNDEGSLSIEVPNSQSWEMAIFKSTYIHIDSPRHIHHFNKKSLLLLLSKAGFSIESHCNNLSTIQFPLSGIRSIDNYLDFHSKNSMFIKFMLKLLMAPYAFFSIVINSFTTSKICLSGVFTKKNIN
jgi:2-polyprenyl-3-methyl-5-hydroxy-6-metoxy-1,4-benzoquinol methylase